AALCSMDRKQAVVSPVVFQCTKSVTGVVAVRSKWAARKAVRAGLALEGAYLDRYVTEEQRSCRPIFIATLRAARLLAGCFGAHRSKTTAGIFPLRFAESRQ